MTISSTALTYLAAARDQVEKVAQRVSVAGAPGPSSGDALDLSHEMVKLLAARTDARVATKLIQTANEVEESALDVLA